MRLTVLLTLLTELCVSGWLIPYIVGSANWAEARPRLGLLTLHSAAVAHLTGLLVFGALAAHDAVEQLMIWLVHADKNLLHAAYAGDRRVDPAWDHLTLALVMGILAALATSIVREARRIGVVRAEHHLVCSVGPRSTPDMTVIESAAPALWCIPRSGGGRIFVTTAALQLLSCAELDAAIAHERAHLVRHHHLMVFAADVMARVLGKLGVLRTYPQLVRHLVELDADDAAVRAPSDRRVLASALLRLGESVGTHPSRAVLAANATSTARRIRRLIDAPGSRSGLFGGLSAITASAVVLVVPGAVVLAPALALAGTGH